MNKQSIPDLMKQIGENAKSALSLLGASTTEQRNKALTLGAQCLRQQTPDIISANKEDIEAVVAEFMAFSGPAFLEVIIDPEAGVYPMVGPGMSYDKMITGDFIKSRSKPRDEHLDTSEMF